jgi:hypothetical protein
VQQVARPEDRDDGIPLKRRFTYELHGTISQKIATFISFVVTMEGLRCIDKTIGGTKGVKR